MFVQTHNAHNESGLPEDTRASGASNSTVHVMTPQSKDGLTL